MATTLYTHTIATLDEVKTWLEIDAATHNDLLNFLMNAMTDAFEKHCHRRLVARVTDDDYITEYFDGEGENVRFVRHPPIHTLNTIYIENVVTLDSEDCADTDQVRYNPATGKITLLQYSFCKYYPRNCYVKYKGGWAVASLPMQIKQAYRHELKRLWGLKSRSNEDITSKSNSLTGETVHFKLPDGLSAECKAMIDPYVIWRFEDDEI